MGLNAQGLFVNSPTKSEQHLSWWLAALQTAPPILCPDEKAANELLEKLFSSLFSSASPLRLLSSLLWRPILYSMWKSHVFLSLIQRALELAKHIRDSIKISPCSIRVKVWPSLPPLSICRQTTQNERGLLKEEQRAGEFTWRTDGRQRNAQPSQVGPSLPEHSSAVCGARRIIGGC